MSKNNLLYKTFRLYGDGFRSMTIGKVLDRYPHKILCDVLRAQAVFLPRCA